MSNQEWTYVGEFRRYRDNQHQLYFEGKWLDIETDMTPIRDRVNKDKKD